jgi:hypothetical protein
MVLDVSPWHVTTAQQAYMPGLTDRLHLHDMRRSLFHTIYERTDRERLQIKAFHNVCLASRMIRWAFARKCSNDIKLCKAVWARNSQFASDSEMNRDIPLSTTGQVCDGVRCTEEHIAKQLVRYSTVEFRDGKSCSSEISDWEKPALSARLVIQFECLDTAGDCAGMCKFAG